MGQETTGLGLAAEDPDKPLVGTDRCFKCHTDPQIAEMSPEALAGTVKIPFGQRPVLRSAEEIPKLLLDREAFEGSGHAKMECTECHQGIELLPHNQSLAVLDCKDCHKDMVAQL